MPKYQKMSVFRPPSWISRGVPHERFFSNFDMLYRIFWTFICFVSMQFILGYPFYQRTALGRIADSSVCLLHLRSPNILKACPFKLCLQLLYFVIQHWFSYVRKVDPSWETVKNVLADGS